MQCLSDTSMNSLPLKPLRLMRSYNTSHYRKAMNDLHHYENGIAELSTFPEKVLIMKIGNTYTEIRCNLYLEIDVTSTMNLFCIGK